MKNQEASRKRGSSSQDEVEDAVVESTKQAKDGSGVSLQETDDVIDDIDEVLREIENPEQWVMDFRQKPGE